MEVGFCKADSSNLPRIDSLMVASFFASNSDFCSSEFKNIKTSVSGRQSYGDDAVGYVQLHRQSDLCTVKCKICPEHKVHSKSYGVTMVVNEKEGTILSVECHDCAASQGGCKHAVAFLFWVHRRSEEPSTTSVDCYWKKSKLAQVGSTLKFMTAKELSKNPPTSRRRKNDVLFEFLKEGKRRKLQNCQILKHQEDHEPTDVQMLSLYFATLKYDTEGDLDKFLKNITHVFTKVNIEKGEKETREQHQCSLWYELRYGRITASKAFEVSRCKTHDGSLIETIMGARVPDTAAMKRGRMLENSVFKVVEEKLEKKIEKCGLIISSEYPFIAASPDGICEKSSVIEIKCPLSEKTFRNYIKDGRITEKCMAQVQLQMYVTDLKKCYFCVANSDFENTHNVTILPIKYDNDYVCNLLNILVSFWKSNIYPLLHKSIK